MTKKLFLYLAMVCLLGLVTVLTGVSRQAQNSSPFITASGHGPRSETITWLNWDNVWPAKINSSEKIFSRKVSLYGEPGNHQFAVCSAVIRTVLREENEDFIDLIGVFYQRFSRSPPA